METVHGGTRDPRRGDGRETAYCGRDAQQETPVRQGKVVSIVDLEDRSIKLGSAVSLYVLVRCIDTAMPFYTFHKQLLISLRCIMGSVCTLPGGIYKPGEIVEPHDFSTSKTEECAPGIHFFITEEEAMDFYTSPRLWESGSWPEEVISDANKYTAVQEAQEKEEQ